MDHVSSPFDNGKFVIGLLVLAVLGGLLASNLFGSKFDAREPPVIRPTIPFVGHLIGMFRDGPDYFTKLSQRFQHPIATLPVLNGRMYIVSSPALVSQVQRASATLDFEQLTMDMLPRLVGVSQKTVQLYEDTKSKEEGREGFVTKVFREVVHPLLTVKSIGDIASTQLQHFNGFVKALPDGLETDLFTLTSREIMNASMHTFYGPENPFAVHPELVEEFWNWEKGMLGYMVGIFPQWTARAAYLGLNRCAEGFTEYVDKGRQSQAYELLRRRQQAHEDLGMSHSEQGRMDVAMSLAFNVNAGFTIFWVLNNIFSRPSLLAEIRDEIRTNALEAPNTIAFSGLRDACPLLNSVYRETLRLVAPLATSRVVLDDTIIAGTYLLRKGAMVQVPGTTLHFDKEIWGPDADSFNARRFYHAHNGSKTSESGTNPEFKENQVHPAAYRSFGGGSSFCPGRHFAQIEILSLAAVMVMGFDMGPPKGQEKVMWDPTFEKKPVVITVLKPSRELKVKLARRAGVEGAKWALKY